MNKIYYNKIVFLFFLSLAMLTVTKNLLATNLSYGILLNEPSSLIPSELCYNEFKISSDDIIGTIQDSKLGKFVPITYDVNQLKYFFKALNNSKSAKVRIAYYGDSIIFGDVITEYLREKFQQQFSGQGVGFVSTIAEDYRMRRTINQTFSNDWKTASFISRNPDNLPFGISGMVSIPKIGSWIKFEAASNFKLSSSFDIIKIYYSDADQNSLIEYKLDGGIQKKVTLQSGNDIKELIINDKNGAKKFELQFISGKTPNFYGISFESKNGVYLDNFSMRGNTGVSLLDISPQVLKDFDKYLSYDLIILHFGANVSAPNRSIFNIYENKMINVVNEFKKVFPGASFLIISSADKAMKKGSEFITNPEITFLLETQKRIVEKTGIAFWNLWEAMGGYNSMNTWVNVAPPKALKDYCHFTTEGGERVSELFFESIIDAFQKYSK